MLIVLSDQDVASLSATARNELLAKFKLDGTVGSTTGPSYAAAPQVGPEYDGIDLTEVADLTYKQVQTWMEAAADKTKLGLRVLADQGPVVRAQVLIDAGITNLPHFQSRTTIRTRTVTGDKGAFLLGWDDWAEAEEGQGRYAVTPITHQSLRRYFQLA